MVFQSNRSNSRSGGEYVSAYEHERRREKHTEDVIDSILQARDPFMAAPSMLERSASFLKKLGLICFNGKRAHNEAIAASTGTSNTARGEPALMPKSNIAHLDTSVAFETDHNKNPDHDASPTSEEHRKQGHVNYGVKEDANAKQKRDVPSSASSPSLSDAASNSTDYESIQSGPNSATPPHETMAFRMADGRSFGRNTPLPGYRNESHIQKRKEVSAAGILLNKPLNAKCCCPFV